MQTQSPDAHNLSLSRYAIVELMRFFGVSDARDYKAIRWGGAALFTGAPPRCARPHSAN